MFAQRTLLLLLPLLLLLQYASGQSPITPIAWQNCAPDAMNDPYQGSPFFFQDNGGAFLPLLAAQQV